MKTLCAVGVIVLLAVSGFSQGPSYHGSFAGNALLVTNAASLGTPTILYVDTNSPGDNYGMPGQPNHPYLHLGYAITNCPAGGIVQLFPGQTHTLGANNVLVWTNSITIIANGANVEMGFSTCFFKPTIADITIEGGVWDHDAAGGPWVSLTGNPSNCNFTARNCVTFSQSDWIKSGTAQPGFNFWYINGVIVNQWACFDCTSSSTNSVFRFINSQIIITNQANGPNLARMTGGHWIFQNCELTVTPTNGVAGQCFYPTNAIVDLIYSHITMTNGSAIWPRANAVVNIWGQPCDTNLMNNMLSDPTSGTIVFQTQMKELAVQNTNGLSLNQTLIAPVLTGVTNPITIFGDTSGDSVGLHPTNLFVAGGVIPLFDINTNILFTTAAGVSTLSNQCWTNDTGNPTYWRRAAATSNLRFITNNPIHVAWEIWSSTLQYSNSFRDGPYSTNAFGTQPSPSVYPYVSFHGQINLGNNTDFPLPGSIPIGDVQIRASNGIPWYYHTTDGQTIVGTNYGVW